jgi:O-antigen/teichoic acid export membrane protein
VKEELPVNEGSREGEEKGERTAASRAFGNAGWNAFSTLWSIGISFAISPILIHKLGITQYGILLLVWSITGVLGIATCGFGEATLRYVAHYHGAGNIGGVDRVLGSTLTFYLAVSTLVLSAFFPAASLIAGLIEVPQEQQAMASWLLRVATITFAVTMLANAYGAIPMAVQRYDISSKITIVQNVIRSGGYIAIALVGLGVLQLVIWEMLIAVATLVVRVAAARHTLPMAKLLPSFSFSGIREIFGYSSFSFLTHIFHTMYRESGKLILGGSGAPSQVAYLGTPESIAYRIYMVIISASETLMPRFSATKDRMAAEKLVSSSTWVIIAASISLLIPLAVLMPDFLRLWIGREFSERAAFTGQLMAASFIAPAAFASMATYFRGTGKPWVVTLAMAGAGLVVFLLSIAMVPALGPEGVAIAYMASSVPWLATLFVGWVYVFGRSSWRGLIRSAFLPLTVAIAFFAIEHVVRGGLGELRWFGLITVGGLFAATIGLGVTMVDLALGGQSPARQIWWHFASTSKGRTLMKFLQIGKVQSSS